MAKSARRKKAAPKARGREAAPKGITKSPVASKRASPRVAMSTKLKLMVNRSNSLKIKNTTGTAIRVMLTTPANQTHQLSTNLANNGTVTVTTSTLTTWLGNISDDHIISYQARNNASTLVHAASRFCFDKDAPQSATYTFANPAPGPITCASP